MPKCSIRVARGGGLDSGRTWSRSRPPRGPPGVPARPAFGRTDGGAGRADCRLVPSCRIHVVAQRVGRLPQLRLEAQRRAIILAVALRSPARHHRPPVNLGAEYTIANLRLLYSAATAGRSPRCCRQRSTHSLVSFSCTPFCDRRRRRVRKSTRSISWSWLKQEKTTVSVPVTGSWWRCRHCAQISFIMHCIGELIDAIARWSERK